MTPCVTPLLAMVARYRRAGFSAIETARREGLPLASVRGARDRARQAGLDSDEAKLACVIIAGRCGVCGCETFRVRCCGRRATPVTQGNRGKGAP